MQSMRRVVSRLLLLVVLASAWLGLQAQEQIRIGRHKVDLPANVQGRVRGVTLPSLGASVGGERNVLVQLTEIPSASTQKALEDKGLRLGDYLGNRAYWARIRDGVDVQQAFRGSVLRSVLPVEPEWKMSDLLDSALVPDWSKTGRASVRLDITYAPNADQAVVQAALRSAGATDVTIHPDFHLAQCVVSQTSLQRVASLPWVVYMSPVAAPAVLKNRTGRSLSRGDVLALSDKFMGRNLHGEGMRVGIWDGNVVYSPDFGKRVHHEEYQLFAGGGAQHGTHVAGTVLGSGMTDPLIEGIAPKAQAWTWNFSQGAPGDRLEAVEMDMSHKKDGITLTQNSYGLPLNLMCITYYGFAYNKLSRDLLMDQLVNRNPTLLPVYACGNEQQGCKDSVEKHYGKRGYGTVSNRTKNSLLVGAVDLIGRMTNFSSWGPMDDGRLAPHVVTKGYEVSSAQPFGGSRSMSGTSMACPTATGHLVLVSQRYKQLHQGQDIRADLLRALACNTATDVAPAGPDFKHGYGILNAEKMVLTIERKWFEQGIKVENGKTIERKIQVPAGAQRARVMLVWNDATVAKVYNWGDKALVNDLDLTVNGLKPWVCDHTKGKVEEPATRKVDDRNNIEQVTFSTDELKGVSELKVNITGTQVPQGPQECVLVWWFEVPDRVRFTTPAGGAQYAPGETLLAHIEDYAGSSTDKVPSTIDISYDGGKTFTGELRLPESYAIVNYTIPKDAKTTHQAVLRLRDQQGGMALSQPFTVAPVPYDLTLDRGTDLCSGNQWKLTWKAAPTGEATNGYALLLGDVSTESWEKLGDIAKDATSKEVADLLKPKLAGRETALLALAAKLENGELGRRSKAVQVRAFEKLKLTPAMIPYAENFRIWPSPYMESVRGVQRTFDMNPYTDRGLPQGSNLIQADIVRQNPDQPYDTLVGFFHEKNKAYLFELRVCQLDMDALKGEKLVLRLRGAVTSAHAHKPKTSSFRVLWDDKPLKDVRGIEVHHGKDSDFELVYELESNGGVHSLRLQHEGWELTRNTADRLLLTGIYIERPQDKPDVGFAITRTPVDGANLGVSDFKLTFVNGSIREEKNLEVNAYVDGAWKASKRIEKLLPYDEISMMFPLDLSVSKPEGAVRHVAFDVVCPGDVYPQDNHAEATVRNYGDVIPMPTSFYLPRELDPRQNAQDPNLRYTIGKRKRIFTDNSGLLGDYGKDQKSTITFEPEDPSMKVRAVFRKFNTKKELGILDVYTNLNAWEKTDDELPVDQLDDDLTATIDGQTYVSGSEDGSLRFFFQSDDREEGAEGWVAEVDLVPASNPLSLLGATIQHTGDTPTADVPVKVTIRNNTKKLVPRALIRVADGFRLPAQQVLQNIPLGVDTFTILQKIKSVPMRTAKKLRIDLIAQDGTMADNKLFTWMVYDRYCIPQWKAGVDRTINFMDKPIQIFQGDGVSSVELSDVEHEKFAHTKIWVDWNNDGTFDAESEQILDTRVDITKTPGKLPFTVDATGHEPGNYRLRALYSTRSADVATVCAKELTENAYMRDYILVIKPGKNPLAGDLSLTYVGVSDPAKGGSKVSKSFTDKESVWITVTNVSHIKWSGKFQATCTVDGKNEWTETVTVNDQLNAWSGYKNIMLTGGKANLSELGPHTIKVVIKELDGLGKPDNNEMATTLFKILDNPTSAGEWVLSSTPEASPDGKKTLYDAVEIEASALELWKSIPRGSKGAFTMELWFNPTVRQYGELISMQGLRIATTYNMAAKQVKDNGLIALIGNGAVVYTQNPSADLVKPGRWHHLAVVVEKIEVGQFQGTSNCEITMYLDGQKVATASEGRDAPSLKGAIHLMTRFHGMIDEFRMWSRALKPQEISANMFKHVRKNWKSDQAEGLIDEFPFNDGPGSAAAQPHKFKNQEHLGLLLTRPERIPASDKCVWRDPRQSLLVGSMFKLQVHDSKQADGSIKVVFPEGTDLSKIKDAEFFTTWPHTKLFYEGKEVTKDTEFDFRANKTVVIKAELEIFGVKLEQEVKFTAMNEASAACELTGATLKKGDNPGLKADVAATITTDGVLFSLNAATHGTLADATKAKVTFTRSAGATLAVLSQGGPKAIEDNSEIDLSDIRLLVVTAANKRSKHTYTLRLEQSQSLTWTEPAASYEYGAESVALEFVSASKVKNPVVSSSTAPNVVSVNAERLYIGGVGTATITAVQPAAKGYAASATLTKSIEVKPKPVKVKPTVKEVPYGHNIPWTFEYEGLVEPNHRALMPHPYRHGDFEIKQNGQVVDPARGPLAKGMYTIAAKHAPYQVGNYTVTPVGGEFTVTQGDMYQLTILVRANASPLENAEVMVNGRAYMTGADGMVTMPVKENATSSYAASKAGYSTQKGSVDIKQADERVEIDLVATTVTLTYKVDGDGGTLFGKQSQLLAEGQTGLPVFAQAKVGFDFQGWDDGKTDNPRSDVAEKADKSFTAKFARKHYTLRYSAGANGSIEGEAQQEVAFEGDGSKVVAKPADGFYFVAWSDGITERERTETKVTASKDVTALFRRMLTIPYVCDFEGAKLPEEWATAMNGRYAQPWLISRSPRTLGDHLDGYFMVVDSDRETKADFESTLYTPRFTVPEAAAKRGLTVAFDLVFRDHTEERANLFLEYDCGDGWKVLGGKITSMTYRWNLNRLLDKSELVGKPYVQFRIRYASKWSYWALVDNVSIFVTGEPKVTLTYKADPPTAGRVLQNGSPIATEELPYGTSGQPVDAVPYEGFKFARWSDGATTPRRPATPVQKSADLVAHFMSGTSMHVTYESTIVGAARFRKGDDYVSEQWIEGGKMTEPVTVEPMEGYKFLYWLSDGSTDLMRPAEEATSDVKHTAVIVSRSIVDFQPAKLTWRVEPEEGGTMNVTCQGRAVTPQSHFDVGDVVDMQFVAKEGYTFKGLVREDTGEKVPTPMRRAQLTLPANLSLVATFVKDPNPPAPEPKPNDPNTEVESQLSLTVRPNPVADHLYVDGLETGDWLTIVSTMGQVYSRFTAEGNAQLDVRSLPAGVYLLRIERGRLSRVVRFVKL